MSTLERMREFDDLPLYLKGRKRPDATYGQTTRIQHLGTINGIKAGDLIYSYTGDDNALQT